MSEDKIIERTKNKPVTYSSLITDFTKIGIKPKMNLLVHSSLSSIGWVCGGVVSVIKALEAVITPDGTLMMPAHSSDLSDPAHWCNPSVPKSWWDEIKKEMPAFDNSLTPTKDMGIIAESFRKQTGVVRSNHPSTSFCAWGKHKKYIIQDNRGSCKNTFFLQNFCKSLNHYDFPQNENSPLGKLYNLDGYVLLLGVNYDKNTSFHLAEYKAKYTGKRFIKDGFPVIVGGKKEWCEYDDILYHSDDFMYIGKEFESVKKTNIGNIGNARSILFSQREIVDFAVDWMEKNRNLT